MKLTAVAVAAIIATTSLVAAEPRTLRALADAGPAGQGATEGNVQPAAGAPKEDGDQKEMWGGGWGRPWGWGGGWGRPWGWGGGWGHGGWGHGGWGHRGWGW